MRPNAVLLDLNESEYGERATFDEAERMVERLDVQAAIAGLDEADRRLLHLRYVDDLVQPLVAQRLGIPEGTVKVRLHRARNRLRALL